jgi:hypothetical protein
MMPIRLSASLLLPAALCSAVAAYFVVQHTPSSPPPLSAEPAGASAPGNAGAPPPSALPPNHPPIGAMSPHGSHGMGATMPKMPNGENQEPAAILWTAPPSWSAVPSPSAMRLATYDLGNGAELSVARAGGSVDANVQRWSAQFDGSPQAQRSEKSVHGLKVTVVQIAGTFLAGTMGTTTPEKHEGWAMRVAIVESTGAPYFFKLVGPAATVDHARADFDKLVLSIAPRDAK